MTASAAPERRYLALSAAILVVIAFGVLHPVLGAGFLQDDWTFLAISSHLDNPLAFYFDDHSPTHFFRPNGMHSWWLLTRAFAQNAVGHYATQILLHAATGVALLWLLRRLACSRATAAAVATLFVVHPATVSTASWLSARFDLLATLGVLIGLAVAAGPRPARPGALAGLLLAAALAVGSKETGLLILPLVALLCLFRQDLDWPQRRRVVLAAFLPVPVWAGLRLWLVGTTLGRPDGAAISGDIVQGIGAWLAWLPSALALDLGTPGALVACVLMLAALLTGLRPRQTPYLPLAVLGLGLLLLPAWVQWPATVHVFPREQPLGHTVNLRFFHLSTAGFALLVALVVEAVRGDGVNRIRRPASLAIPLIAALVLAPVALGRSAGLAAISSDATDLALQAALVRTFQAEARGAGCKIEFQMPQTVNLPGFADHVVKASLPRGHLAVDSLVLTDPMPWFAVVRPAGATPDALAPLEYRRPGNSPLLPSATGNLFQVFMDLPADAANAYRGCPLLRFRWEGGQFVQVPAAALTERVPESR